jgi:uncharacterized protein
MSLAADVVFPMRPAPDHWVVDEQGLVSAEDEGAINATCFALWRDERVPLYVVTIRSLADKRATGDIEDYAKDLFDSWGVGSERREFGILLLVSARDHKARIELGAGWKLDHDADATALMDGQLVPHFKKDEYSAGIVAGVRGLDAMARGLALPSPYYPPEVVATWLATGVLTLGMGISLVRSGRSGWGWGAIAMAAGILGLLGRRWGSTQRDNNDSGSGFGGGHSGGGGATGSW